MSEQHFESRTASRRRLLASIGASGLAMAAGCLGEDSSVDADVSAAWIYFAEADDQGWTSSHDRGRRATGDQLDNFEGDFVESVDASDVEQTASQFAEEGFDVVFGLSASFTDPMASASEEYPDTAFEVASGIDTGENYGAFHEKLYHARYLVGYATGMLTENDNIGYIAANPVSTVYQEINGFASGVADANDDATVYVRWTNSWYDPPTEGENAQALIDDENVDIMAQHQDSPSALETASENGIWASGYAESAADFAGDNYLMTPVFNWEEAYIQIIEEARDGEWEADYTFPGIGEGAVDISDPGPEVPSEVVDAVTGLKEEMESEDADDIVWSGTPYESWSEEDVLFDSSSFEIDNIEGQEL